MKILLSCLALSAVLFCGCGDSKSEQPLTSSSAAAAESSSSNPNNNGAPAPPIIGDGILSRTAEIEATHYRFSGIDREGRVVQGPELFSKAQSGDYQFRPLPGVVVIALESLDGSGRVIEISHRSTRPEDASNGVRVDSFGATR